MKKILFSILVLAGITATAQVKVGSNPTTINTTTTNFQVEGTTTGDQFVVLKNGNVGIGTTNPFVKFHVQRAGAGNVARFDMSDGVSGAPQLDFRTSANTNGAAFTIQSLRTGLAEDAPLAINPNGGNVGIGTTTPTFKTEISCDFLEPFVLNLNARNISWGNTTNHNQYRFIQTNHGDPNDSFKQFNVGANGVSIGYSNVPAYASTDALYVNGNVGIGTTAPNAALQLGNVTNNKRIVLWEDVNNDHQFYGLGINAGMLRYQINATQSSHAFFVGTGATTSNELMRIQGNGNIGIGTSAPTAKLHVIGNVIATGGYADYVLEDFVDGKSSLNPTYDRKSLTDVKEFIKTNKHLPGVTAVKDLKVASNGEYEIDITKLQVQLLEKIEELYLHTIEQQEQIEVLKSKIKTLEENK